MIRSLTTPVSPFEYDFIQEHFTFSQNNFSCSQEPSGNIHYSVKCLRTFITHQSHVPVLQTLATNSFHYLRPVTRTKLTTVNSVVVPELCGIISRFESSQAAQGKDVILQVPAESLATKIPGQESASSVVTENIPDIPVVGSVDALPEIIAEAVVPLVCFCLHLSSMKLVSH